MNRFYIFFSRCTFIVQITTGQRDLDKLHLEISSLQRTEFQIIEEKTIFLIFVFEIYFTLKSF